MDSILKVIVVYICLVYGTLPMKAQSESLYKHEAYFKSQEANLSEWLTSIGWDSVLLFDTLQIEMGTQQQEFLRVRWQVTSLAAWTALNDSVQKAWSISLGELLFERLQFLFEISPLKLVVDVSGPDCYNIIQLDNLGNVNTKIKLKQGGNITINDKTKVSTPIESYTGGEFKVPYNTLSSMERKLNKGLRKYFTQHTNSPDVLSYKFSPRTDYEWQIEVSNASKLVLDFPVFEKIRVIIRVKEAGAFWILNYRLHGKLSSTPSNEPYDTSLQPMDPRYRKFLTTFSRQLGKEIGIILSKPANNARE